MKPRSQKARILHALENSRIGVCGTTLLARNMPRYAARIGELRADGVDIVTEPCNLHWHVTRQVKYRLAVADEQLTL